MAGRGGRPEAEKAREHERRAWDLRQQGWTHARIAAELGLERSAVTRILARVNKRVLKEMHAEVAAQKVEQSARLDFVIDEALQAWERSKKDAVKVTREWDTPHRDQPDEAEAACDEPPETVVERVTHERQGRDGDVRFLEQTRQALADQRKVWGIDAPAKVAPTTPDGQGEYTGGRWSDEELDAGVRSILQRYGLAGPPAEAGEGSTAPPDGSSPGPA
jgi:hypothetical protein